MYVGLYGYFVFGNMIIMLDGDGILLNYGRFGRFRLLLINEELFLGYFLDSFFFIINLDGNIELFVIDFKFNVFGVVESIEFFVDFLVL